MCVRKGREEKLIQCLSPKMGGAPHYRNTEGFGTFFFFLISFLEAVQLRPRNESEGHMRNEEGNVFLLRISLGREISSQITSDTLEIVYYCICKFRGK